MSLKLSFGASNHLNTLSFYDNRFEEKIERKKRNSPRTCGSTAQNNFQITSSAVTISLNIPGKGNP